jgi:hypothetical protein
MTRINITPEQFKALINHPWTIIILGTLSLGLSVDILHSATFGFWEQHLFSLASPLL